MKIAIRVDSSLQIGTGHVMRCLTLADALKAKGAKVVFVCREHPGHLCDKIAGKGFEVFRLESGSDNDSLQADSFALTHASWLGTSQSVDVTKTIAALHDNAPWDWIIVDHYALDHCWESAMCKVANNIMVIDDLADRKHECDLLLDQNYFQEPEKRYESLLLEHCKTLLGPKYALLRPEFREARKFCRMRGNGIARILVYFGGNNPDNLTGMALEALSTPELEHLLVEAVIGPNNQHQEQLEKQAKNRPGTRLHVQPENFTELMLRADFCIGAGGTTTWERLCLGLPSLVITVAQNQEPFTRELDEAGYVRWLGNKEQVNVSDIRESLISEIHRSQNLENSDDPPSLVDGYGALRAAEKLVPSDAKDLSLRQAVQEDMELFFTWANDP
ncbi:MAG: UDP-2,4-diacetamido-2,4,6-trideoxy-beta-L-altropyranose hydrolase, partial [Desulfobacterales bacterium]